MRGKCRGCGVTLTGANARKDRGYTVGACRKCESAEARRRQRKTATHFVRPRGTCGDCGLTWSLNNDGTLRRHGTPLLVECPGSWQRPGMAS